MASLRKRANLDEMFDAVFDSPQDEALRLVLADALAERGEPRGELILEQHRRESKGARAPSTRERALLKKHGEALMGPLATVLRQPTFRLGFLSGAALKGGRHDFAALHGEREWRTIESLSIGSSASNEMALALLGVPALVSLREVKSLSAEVLVAALKSTDPLAWERVTSVSLLSFPVGLREIVRYADRLPKLKVLGFSGSTMMSFPFEEYEPLFGSPLAAQLEHLSLHCEFGDADRVRDAARAAGIKQVDVTES